MTEKYIKCNERNPIECGNDWERDERDPHSPFCEYHCLTCGRTWNVCETKKTDWDNAHIETNSEVN
jgi:hypothetical protein|tara:strand:- start:426 stop:623 length:198 start_codon:yes stop_codon:yes gene_type:complete